MDPFGGWMDPYGVGSTMDVVGSPIPAQQPDPYGMMSQGIGMLPPSGAMQPPPMPQAPPPQMPQMPQQQQPQGPPGYDPFEFGMKGNWQMPLIQAGAALLGSGGHDFGGAMGAFGDQLGVERGIDMAQHENTYERALDSWKTGHGLEREGIEDDRYDEEMRLKLEGRDRKWGNEDVDREREASERQDEFMRRQEQLDVIARGIGADARKELESLDAYEARIKMAEADKEREEEKSWWREQEGIRQAGRVTQEKRGYSNSDIRMLADDLAEPGGEGSYVGDGTRQTWQPAPIGKRMTKAKELLESMQGKEDAAPGGGGDRRAELDADIPRLKEMPREEAWAKVEEMLQKEAITSEEARYVLKQLGG